MVRFMRYNKIFRFYEAAQPFLKYSPVVEEKLPGKTVLVIAPHADDEAIGCGGTIVRHVKGGGSAEVIYCTTDGRERELEAAEAAKVLGFARSESLGYPVESLGTNREFPDRLFGIFEERKPDIVFIPFVLDGHTDHRAINEAFIKRRGSISRGFMVYSYPVWMPLYPNLLIDVSNEWETKKAAINCYKSQIATRDYVKMSKSLGEYWATVKGRQMQVAESFFRATLEEYTRLCVKILK